MFVHSAYQELPRRQPTDRIFFAIRPDACTAASLDDVARDQRVRHGLTGRPLETGRLHVKLHHVGDYAGLPRQVVAAACDIASTVAMPPFTMAFNSAGSFRGRPGNRPFVLLGDDGVTGVMMLQQRLGEAMEKAGLGHCASSYTPHVTLLYDDRLVADNRIDTIAWPVREFVLVHSLLGRSRHRLLARFPLRPQA